MERLTFKKTYTKKSELKNKSIGSIRSGNQKLGYYEYTPDNTITPKQYKKSKTQMYLMSTTPSGKTIKKKNTKTKLTVRAENKLK